ncbi:MAG: zf-HC2 domain-containing protein [Thermobispora bispora]|nr:zf-HC2 domain-containing protein [Thermobispora bispora]
MNCRVTLSLGVYVLGALEPRERAYVEEHLVGCAACRNELVRLAPLPGARAVDRGHSWVLADCSPPR